MGRLIDESQVNFDSMPCSEFDQRDEKEELALETITVCDNIYHIAGLKTQLSDGSSAYETQTFNENNCSSYYEMNLKEFDANEIKIQT